MNVSGSKFSLFTVFILLIAVLSLALLTGPLAADDVIPANCIGSIGIVSELIDAIEEANSDPDHDTVVLGTECIYAPLNPVGMTQNGLPVITEDLTIEGNGSTITRSGIAPMMRILEAADGVNLTLQDVNFKDGSLTSGNGGAVLAAANSTLNLENAGFENNKAENGGAVYTVGDLNINGGTFFNNEATAEVGGAIFAGAGGEVNAAMFQENVADEEGGAIHADGQLVIHDSVFLQNDAQGAEGAGGAVYMIGQVDVFDSKFYGNSAGTGGALVALDARVERSVFYQNYTDTTLQEDGGLGGALYILVGSRGLTGNHFHDNNATKQGGAVYVASAAVLSANYFLYNSAGEQGSALVIDQIGGDVDDMMSQVENNLLRSSGVDSPPDPSLISLLNQNDSGGAISFRHNTLVNIESDISLNNLPLSDRLSASRPAQPEAESLASWTAVQVGSGEVDVENNVIDGFKVGLHALGGTVESRSNLYFENGINEVGLAQPGSDLLDANPQFANFDNFRLTSGSPAENSGINTGLGVDIRGKPRDDGQPDRGAYEYDGEKEAVFLVECGDEAGLVEAIKDANNHIGPDIVHLQGEQAQDCLFELTEAAEQISVNIWVGLPLVTDQLILDGAGAIIRRDVGADPFQLLLNISHPLLLQNLSLENGIAESNYGGAVQTVDIENSFFDLGLLSVTLKDNFASISGGGAYAEGGLLGYEVLASGNESAIGGALGADDAIDLSESDFQGNMAQYGGAVFAEGIMYFSRNSFFENVADEIGGAVYATGEIEFDSNFLVENSAGDSGGGLAIQGAQEISEIINNLWVKNSAVDEGAAFYVHTTVPDTQLSLSYNTFVGDGTPNLSGIYLYSQSTDNVSFSANTNIINNFGRGIEHPGPSGAGMTTNQNLYFENDDNEAGDYDSSTNHILDEDPLFLSPIQNDYRLQENSPARDAAELNGLEYDRLNVERPQGSKPDIGAHEFTDNIPPTARADYYFAIGGVPLEIPAPGVLANDKDFENGPLQAVIDEETIGDLQLNEDGSFLYTAPTDFSGQDRFFYFAQDSGGLTENEFVVIIVIPGEETPPPTPTPTATQTATPQPGDDELLYMPVIQR